VDRHRSVGRPALARSDHRKLDGLLPELVSEDCFFFLSGCVRRLQLVGGKQDQKISHRTELDLDWGRKKWQRGRMSLTVCDVQPQNAIERTHFNQPSSGMFRKYFQKVS